MSTCEKCWANASNAAEYFRLIRDRVADPCTPEEQAGPAAEQCPKCKRMTLHQHTRQPMCGCKPSRA